MSMSGIPPQCQGPKQIPLPRFYMIFYSYLAKYSNLILIRTLYQSHLYTRSFPIDQFPYFRTIFGATTPVGSSSNYLALFPHSDTP